MERAAYANIAPLKIKQDGVEPLQNPGIMISSANVDVTPLGSGYKFNCSYILKGLNDSGKVLIGIPADIGYTLEAGYIEDLGITVDGKDVKPVIYETTKNLSDSFKNYNSPLNFKWHTFEVPVSKDRIVNINMSYMMKWRINSQGETYTNDQDKTSPYYIVPFILSTDKFFGDSTGTYTIKYTSDDTISIPDVKVMINSVSEPNTISQAISSPIWDNTQIIWTFNNVREFQDFRLIELSFRKLAMEFSSGTIIDKTIKWSMLNNDYEKLASSFENIATKKVDANLKSEELGTAAYLAAEFYCRQGKYDKAREMLSLPDQSMLWLTSVKADYIDSLLYKQAKNSKALLDEYKRLYQYKDYILVSSLAKKEIEPLSREIEKQNSQNPQKTSEQNTRKTIIYYCIAIFTITVLIIISALAYNKYMKSKK
jgi:hypothetical protein